MTADRITALFATALDAHEAHVDRLAATSELILALDTLRDQLAKEALKVASLRDVARHAGLALGTAHRRWGEFNPRSRS